MTQISIPQRQPAGPLFAIYNPVTKKWSRGGTGPKWSKTAPKTWTMGHLKNHLAMFVHRKYIWNRDTESSDKVFIKIDTVYDNCQLVIVSPGSTTGNFSDVTINSLLLEKAIKEAEGRFNIQFGDVKYNPSGDTVISVTLKKDGNVLEFK